MKGDGQYLGCLKIEAACLAFDLTITVIPVSAVQVPTKHGSGQFAFCLWYSGCHYDLLLPTAGAYPLAVSSVQNFGGKSGGRGGGSGDADDDEELDALTIYTTATGGGRKPRPKRPAPILAETRSEQVPLFEPKRGGCQEGKMRCNEPLPQTGTSSGARAEVVPLQVAAESSQIASDAPAHRPPSVIDMLRRPTVAPSQASCAFDPSVNSAAAGGLQTTAASRDDEVASQDLENIEPPPPAPLPRRVRRASWKCKYCDFRTKVGLSAASIDAARLRHLHAWHKDRKAHWSSYCRWRFKTIPDAKDKCQGQQEVLWQRKHCTAGIVGIKSEGRKQAGAVYLAAVRHCRECHPQIKAWRRDRKHTNFKKATAVRRAAGVASHLLRKKACQYGAHEVVVFRIPWLKASTGGKQRKTANSYVCLRCAGQGATPASIMQHHCDPGRMPVGRGRSEFVARLTRALDDDHPADLKEGIRGVLQVFAEVAERLKKARAATAKAEGVTEHHIQAVAWPKLTADTTSFAARYVCQRCHYHASLMQFCWQAPPNG